MGTAENQQEGKLFEELFTKQAQRAGFLVQKNLLSAKFTWGGRTQLVKSQLDFTLADQTGKVGFFDTKSYGKDFFTFSDLDPKQVERALLYNEWSIPSGFVVWFRPSNRVVFFSGRLITQRGSRSRFQSLDGVSLGSFERFDLKLALR